VRWAPAGSTTPLVVIAHSDPHARQQLGGALAGEGYPYLSTADAETAHAFARVPGVSLVITDLHARADGEPCLVRTLRRDPAPAVRDLPLLVYTWRFTASDCARVMAEGGDAILRMPAPLPTVVEQVRRMAGPAPTVAA
jgi:CheY-like chemotaxis protein